MYVDDDYDIELLEEFLAEAEGRLAKDPDNEQAQWDIEDITERIEYLVKLPEYDREHGA